MRAKTINLLEENLRVNTDIWFGNSYLEISSKAHATTTKKINRTSHKNFKDCVLKETIKKMKRQLTEWENKISNYISHKGHVPKIYKEYLQLNKKGKQLNFLMGKGSE